MQTGCNQSGPESGQRSVPKRAGITPFQYVQLLGSVLVGYLFFGDLPDALTWLGAAIVMASGLYIGWTQTRRA